MKNLITLIGILFCTYSYTQAYRIQKITTSEGLMQPRAKGVFQDELGRVWIANGHGFTRFSGNLTEQIIHEKPIFKFGFIHKIKKIGGAYYWGSFKMSNDSIQRIEYDSYNTVKLLWGQDLGHIAISHPPFVDRYGYSWTHDYYSVQDSTSIVRYGYGDTINAVNTLEQLGIQFESVHYSARRYDQLRILKAPLNFVEDNNGDIWFNDKEKNALRLNFNEKRVERMTKSFNLANVYCDKEGNSWLSTYPNTWDLNPGIKKINGESVKEFPATGEAKVIANGDQLYLLDESGLHQYEDGRFTQIVWDTDITDVDFNSHGDIIFRTYNFAFGPDDTSRIYHYSDGRATLVFEKDYYIMGLTVDREDIVWIPTDEGVYKLIPSKIKTSIIDSEKSAEHFKTKWGPTVEMANGNKFFETPDGIFFKSGDNPLIPLDLLPGKKIEDIFFYRQREDAKSSISSGSHCKIIKDENDNVYVASRSSTSTRYLTPFGDIYKITPELEIESLVDGELTQFQEENIGPFHLQVYQDEVFLMTWNRIFYKENGAFKMFELDSSFRNATINEAKGTQFVFITAFEYPDEEHPKDRFGRGKEHTYTFNLISKEMDEFTAMDSLSFEDSRLFQFQNKDWVCFTQDVAVLSKNGEMITIEYGGPTDESLMPDLYHEPIVMGDNNVVYDCAENGLMIFDYEKETFYNYGITDGLSSSDFYSIFFNEDSTKLWATSSDGIDRIDFQSMLDGEGLKAESWTAKDGFEPVSGHQFGPDSTIIFNTTEGYLTIDLKKNNLIPPPNLILKEVQLGSKLADWKNFGCEMNTNGGFSVPNQMQLTHDQNHLTFYFQGVSQLPVPLIYEYQMVGLEASPIETQNKSIAYPDLSDGSYEFKVRTKNMYGTSDWHSVSFEIAKPWYRTTLARIAFLILALLSVFGFVRSRTAKLQKRQRILETKVEERTAEVVEQKDMLEERNKEILDSITYAKRLQTAILPPVRLVKEWLNDSFIFYKPKDIVAGDFYWMETAKRNGRNIIFYAAADCTGHGVPGAMVSVVCSNALKRAVKEFDISDPGELLDKVAELVQEAFEQSEHEVKDGMDIAVCAVDLMDRKVWFSGANNALYRITSEDTKTAEGLKVVSSGNRKLVEYAANKQPVGSYEHMVPFTTVEIQLEPGDCIYLFSDGFADQFGGEDGKKFKYKPFKQLLLDIEAKEMDSQKDILDTEFERWRGNLEQVDDVCIIGLRVNGHMRKLFSKRELEVIEKIKDGRQSKEIADELNIAKSTVDTHRKRILAKTNLGNAAELIKFCEEHEVI